MRRLIRNGSGLYLKKDGTWTSDWQQAEEFPDTTTAIAAKLRDKLTAVSLVLIMGDKPNPRCDVVVPL